MGTQEYSAIIGIVGVFGFFWWWSFRFKATIYRLVLKPHSDDDTKCIAQPATGEVLNCKGGHVLEIDNQSNTTAHVHLSSDALECDLRSNAQVTIEIEPGGRTRRVLAFTADEQNFDVNVSEDPSTGGPTMIVKEGP